MSVRLGHQVSRSFVFTTSHSQIFGFIALINDLNNQTKTIKSSGTSSSTFHQIISSLRNVFFGTNLSNFAKLSTSFRNFFETFFHKFIFGNFNNFKFSSFMQIFITFPESFSFQKNIFQRIFRVFAFPIISFQISVSKSVQIF